MNFKQATDALLQSVTLEDLANALKVSVQSVRQARLAEESTGHRRPPPDWEGAAIRLATARIRELSKLTKALERQGFS